MLSFNKESFVFSSYFTFWGKTRDWRHLEI